MVSETEEKEGLTLRLDRGKGTALRLGPGMDL